MSESKKFTNPFPGLRPFETDEYRLFFGREGQSDQLIMRLQRSRFLAVVGTSGSGKSSLVRAGLLPSLRGGMMAGAGSGWHICIMRPGNDPFGNLAHELAKPDVLPGAAGGLTAAEAEAVIEATLRRGSLGLVDVAQYARLAEQEKLLVVVDQFEELFRFRAARAASSMEDDASAFVKVLLEGAQQRKFALYVVLTMRSDFLGDCAQFQGLPEAINDGQYLIPRMTRDERRMAITGPVGVARGKIAEPLVNRLLNDVGDNPDQLPILQHALMRTWDDWMAHRRNGEPISLQNYENIGTMTEALSLHAEEAWSELADGRSRHVAEKLFKALTEKGADNREIRRPAQLSEISGAAEATEAEVIAVIEVFRRQGRSFLMPPAEIKLTSNTVIDISHESLIRNWDRLQKWVDEESQSARTYRRLAEAAVLHCEGKEGVLTNPALQIALEWRDEHRPNQAWANRYDPEFETAIAFLVASREHHDSQLAAERAREQRELERTREFADKQARAARRLRWLTAGMGVMFLLAMVTAGYAFVTGRQAIILKDDALKQKSVIASLLESEKKEKEKASIAEKEAEDQSGKAEVERQKAVAASTRAQQEQSRAEKEAERANEQAGIAARNLENARQATTAASSIVRRAIPVVSQGNLLLKGSEAYRHEELDKALTFFDELRKQLETLGPSSSTQPAKMNLTIEELQDYAKRLGQYEQFSLQLGWTLSRIGSTHLQKEAPEKAIGFYEQALKVFDKVPESSTDPIKLETYLGLAEAYHNVAANERSREGKSGSDKSKSEENFKKSEDYFNQALSFQQGALVQESWIVADTHLKLARLYVDGGRFEQAETSFKNAVEGRRRGKNGNALDDNERAAEAGTLRELAEFYQGQENRYDDAVRVFNEMITLQEDIGVSDLAEQGQEIANSYSDLGQLYSERGESLKAENVFHVANLLQRTALKLRRMGRLQNTKSVRAILHEIDNDLDELGDAYVTLGKFPDAEAIYSSALEYRNNSDDDDLWKSYQKLAKFYRISMKDYTKAEDNSKLLVEICKSKPRSGRYADALILLASLYGDVFLADAAKAAQAESLYNQALEIYSGRNFAARDWRSENLILFRLSKLYEKQQRVPAREQALRRRVDTLTQFFNQLGNPAGPQPTDAATLVSEYLYAINALAAFYDGQNTAGAEGAYVWALKAHDYITRNIYNAKIMGFYADTLKDYKQLLNKVNKPTEANDVAQKEKDVRERLRQFDQIREQQSIQQLKQSPATAP